MEKINFEDGTKTQDAYITIDGVNYIVTSAKYTGKTPLSAFVLNKLQTNIKNAMIEIQENLTDEYSAASTYALDDYCIYNNKLYKCIVAIKIAEEFNSDHWKETTISAELKNKLDFEIVEEF